MMRNRIALLSATLIAILLAACQTDSRQQILATTASSVELRSVQTRAFDTTDRNTTIRTVIATLQDLGFVIDQVDEKLGSVSATRLDTAMMRMMVTVRPRNQTQTSVRASAQYGLEAVTDARPFQQFFNALEQAMFLTAHQVD